MFYVRVSFGVCFGATTFYVKFVTEIANRTSLVTVCKEICVRGVFANGYNNAAVPLVHNSGVVQC